MKKISDLTLHFNDFSYDLNYIGDQKYFWRRFVLLMKWQNYCDFSNINIVQICGVFTFLITVTLRFILFV